MNDAKFTLNKASIHISDLSFVVIVKNQVKRILRKITFYLADGDMCAVLGPSGAGKR